MKKKKTKREISQGIVKYLYYFEDYSFREIEKLFGVSGETVRKKLKANQKKKSG